MPFHLRIHADLFDYVSSWVRTHNDRYVIGAREIGKKGETPHYHIWLDTKLSKESLKKVCQAACAAKGYKGERGKANAYYALLPWDDRFGYMTKTGVLEWKGVPDDHPDLKPSLPTLLVSDVEGAKAEEASGLPASSSPIAYRIQKPRSNESMRSKFVKYLEKERGYARECITPGNRVDMKKAFIDDLVDFWENAFTTPQGAACIEHAMWYFADEEFRKELKLRAYARLNEILRC